jgi:signal transduction histidine kinase
MTENVFTTQIPREDEVMITRVDGLKCTLISTSTIYKDTTGQEFLVGVVHDITERKKAQDALRQANRQLKLLSGITRHDINNKVTAILGLISIAEMESKDPSMAEYFRDIETATREIRSQIEFTKVYQDLGTQEPQWQELHTTITSGSNVPGNIKLSVHVPGVELYADPMLEKVFFNLLDNSIRHGEQVTEIRVSAEQSDEGLIVVLEDNGTGIPVDQKEKIFKRGFGKNTGFGLFLVREILSLTGITIKETGVRGKGARFEISVPSGAFRLTIPG